MWHKFKVKPIHSTKSEHACCTTQPTAKAACPGCALEAKSVLAQTLKQMLTSKAQLRVDDLSGFYYCKTPSCPIIYFNENVELFQKDLTVIVGLKQGSLPDTLCYCFEWTKTAIEMEWEEKGESRAVEDITEKMASIGCSCESLNPSGRCCLIDINQVIALLKP